MLSDVKKKIVFGCSKKVADTELELERWQAGGELGLWVLPFERC